MGRTVLADDTIQAYVENLYKYNTWFIGIIVGKLTSQKDYAVHIVRTPEPQEDRASEDDEGDEEEDKSRDRKRKTSKTQNKPTSLEDLNEQWTSTHVKQVRPMLPGGLDVIGIFAVAPPAMMTKAQAKLRQILFAIQKMEKKSSVVPVTDPISDRVLLQICSTTRKFTCRTIDVGDPKSTFRPADWKFQSTGERWSCVRTNLNLDLQIDIPVRAQASSLPKQIQAGLQPFCQRIAGSLILFNGSLRDPGEVLDQTAGEKKGKTRDKENTSQQSYSCSVLLKHSQSSDTAEDPVTEEFSPRLSIRGTVCSQGYVVGKATVGDAEQAIRTDAIRSVLSRCELLCDDLQMIEEDAEKPEVYTMPRRVFFQLPGTSVELSDYMFTDERPTEVLSRVQELLDIPLTEDHLDLDRERAPNEDDMSQLLTIDVQNDPSQTRTSEGNQGFRNYIVAGIGGVLAVLAAGLTYLAAGLEET